MKRVLGKSGIEVSATGLGCWAIGGPWAWNEDRSPAGWGQTDDAESIRAIHAGLDRGVTLFDTAANYGCGHSEMILGQALAGRRHEVIIATKFGHIIDEEKKFAYEDDDQILGNLKSDCENSLRRLNTDVIDFYQLHAPQYDKEKAPLLLKALEELVTEGKIRYYGWSTDSTEHVELWAEGEHCAGMQFGLNIFLRNDRMREIIEANNLIGLNKSPLNSGLLSGNYDSETIFAKDEWRSQVDLKQDRMVKRFKQISAIREVLTSGGRTMAQGSLAWIWAHDPNMIPIPGFRNVQQASDNAAAMDFGPLSEDEMGQIEGIIASFEEIEESPTI